MTILKIEYPQILNNKQKFNPNFFVIGINYFDISALKDYLIIFDSYLLKPTNHPSFQPFFKRYFLFKIDLNIFLKK